MIKFSIEFYINIYKIKEILNFNISMVCLKPFFLTITYNKFNINKKVINYLIKNGLKVSPHIICKKKIRNFNYLLNSYFLINLKNLMIIKGDNSKNNYYYSYNILNLIKKNYINKFNVFLGDYAESHPNSLNFLSNIKNNKIKNIVKKNINFISQYFYNIESYYNFYDSLKKINYKIKLIPGIMFINDFYKIISFSNICKTELPLWIIKKINNNKFYKKEYKKINKEIILNLILKLLNFKVKILHFYSMNNLYLVNIICESLNNNLNL
ncbi:5,10-methylenetetrahydrofolate reductase [Candidatus Nasuia deltocephalinicola]|uniref:Methylenetetrahydrofolate reductase n=1 Tax=Candidatus Nasuia deltocephalincola TaxID=1160784 RepID=A0A7G6UHQ3_9PROT|nr:5,10-methylenetetrahydrofolate reductase [Candidatus Nasuia deltocephalinicola]